MSHGDISGRARTSIVSPRAFGVCDDCGEWYNLVDLVRQMEFFGRTVKWTGYLVCLSCNDKPQPQLQPYILPPDPVPVVNPRPEAFQPDRGVAGYTQITIWPPILRDGTQAAKNAVLAQVASVSGIPTPARYIDLSTTLAKPSTAYTVVPAVTTPRSWLAFYNPSNGPVIVSAGAAAFAGDPQAILLGPGNALVQGANFSLGAVTAAALQPGAPIWVFATPEFDTP